jgi:Mg2+-importing ATPase
VLFRSKLSVVDIFPFKHSNPLVYASIATSSLSEFEKATRDVLTEEQKNQLNNYSVIKETAFDPVHRRTSKLVKGPDGTMLIVKGAFEEISSRCNNIDSQALSQYTTWAHDNGAQGNRVIGIAVKHITDNNAPLSAQEKDLMLCGLIAFADPIKKTVPDALHKAQSLGIKIKILTGDSADVAGTVAATIGLIASPQEVTTGAELEKLSPTEQEAAIDHYTVFARVTPQQKYAIVEHLKKSETVGFLGDGINDAPALKPAHVGIVVVEASDIARSAADIILLKKSLAVIIEGIARGRTVFVNTTKYVKTTLSANLGNFYSIAIASFFLEHLPMLPIQLLLVNLITDCPMIAIATDNVEPDDLKRPTSYPIREFGMAAIVFGAISSLFDFIVFITLGRGPIKILQTTWFLTSSLTELVFIFAMRSRKSILLSSRPSWALILLSISAALVTVILPFTHFGQDILSFTRPSLKNMIFVVSIALGYLLVTEIAKWYYYQTPQTAKKQTKRQNP